MGIVLLKGKEDYLVRRYLDRVLSDENLSVHRTDTLDEAVLSTLSDVSLLGDRNVIVWEKETLGAEEREFVLLREYGTGDGCVIIKAASVRENTKFFRWLKENAQIRNCEPLTPAEYGKFLSEENERRGGFMTGGVLSFFEEHSRYGMPGVDLSMVDGWLSELWILSKAGETVTEKEVMDVVRVDAVNTAFELIGKIAEGDMPGLFETASHIREDAVMVLGALFWSFRILSKLKIAGETEIGVSPFQTRNLRPLKRLSEREVDRLVDAVSEGTAMIKSGVEDSEALTHTLSEIAAVVRVLP